MTDHAMPIARIILRYVVGMALMGSAEIGEHLAADPDLILFTSVAVGAVVEALYAAAKRLGWNT